MSTLRILLTGSRGFIGSALARRFDERGHVVYGTVSRARDDGASGGVREIVADMRNPGFVASLPDDVDIVVHSAAMIHATRFSREAYVVNAGGTARLVAWARARGVRHFLHVGSIAAYGMGCVGENRAEDNTGLCRVPLHAYLYSKALAEGHVVRGGVPYTILRPPSVIGPGDTYATPAIVPALLSGEFPYIKRRDARFSTLGIENLADIVEAVLARGPANEAFNCTDGETTWEHFVETYASALGRSFRWKSMRMHTLITRASDSEYQYLVANGWFGAHFPNDRLRTYLDYRPARTIEATIADAVRAYVSQPK